MLKKWTISYTIKTVVTKGLLKKSEQFFFYTISTFVTKGTFSHTIRTDVTKELLKKSEHFLIQSEQL